MADKPEATPQEPVKSRAEMLFDRLWGDKTSVGREIRKTAKEMFPDIRNPDEEVEAAVAPVVAEVGALKGQLAEALDRLKAREKADEDLRAENDLSVRLTTAVKRFGLTDEGRQKMMDRMKETGNFTDADAAAAWVHTQTPAPVPTTSPSWLPQESNLFGSRDKDEQFEALHKDPRKYLDDQLRDFVRNPDRYVAETFGT